jgi:hypothetical protein
MKEKLASVKNFVVDRKDVIIAMAIVIPTVVVVGQHAGLKSHDAFLKEHGLYDEYHRTDEE